MMLRFVRRRVLASVVGSALVAAAAWVELGSRLDAWWLEGCALIAGATGVAILWTGITGTAPDWIDKPD